MNILSSSKRHRTDDRPRLLLYCLLVSLTLHVLIVAMLPFFATPQSIKIEQQPTIVRLVDRPRAQDQPKAEKPPEYEIDQKPQQPPPVEPVESFRKAEQDQRVIKEQAPKGDDVRDQSIIKPPSQQRRPAPQPAITKQPTASANQTVKEQKNKSLAPAEKKILPQPQQPPAAQTQPQTPSLPPLLTPEQLRPDLSTLDQIARGESANRNRIKQRDDVEIGDTIWLNLQHDLLVSFFRRFHDQIERVWNYPPEAAQAGIEGTLELLIIVNKNGVLDDVIPQTSSGSEMLDFEAIQAVYRAQPFGPLTKHYPHEKLKIRAHFRYSIVGKYIYGRQ